ncbi:hypothetical protein CK203_005424 [Vitis vinifera]|uniref:Uncharacterized protein n=1 Tax=Vitis vinifera TaxID=29760 RepID=A0A438K474_VITVI|nr:hypothetical protein CK203_005424 [Vitis vinifera]
MKGLRNVRNGRYPLQRDKGREMEGAGDIDDAQVVRSEMEGNWEESGLARFSKAETERLGTGQRAPNCSCPMKDPGDSRLEAVNAEGASGGILYAGIEGLWNARLGGGRESGFVGEFGAIRGLWEDPWCIGGILTLLYFKGKEWAEEDSSAMRNFAEIVDDLGLVDLPLQGGDFTWNGGFIISLGLYAIGGKIDVRGSASYKLAIKMKEIKQKLKVWNREVFGKLESNKSAALQQVEFWDREENDRILTMEESELKKEAKEDYKKWVIMEELTGDNFLGRYG